ncbi:AsmA family protein [Mucilaginibacter sp. RB4R14]|uniref:AsmA family protein n=1 Tax=Mucilaginibacter aurantiaciroseus TaxID=2949308 RepID=UPI0020918779|nr:AsmA-like C-terminal region-containing protein [Mucilaginibacter aurantiaciroseus]MCO5936419.1 AsmA family protein [Mucilaginibacter aurantiaciroseus]
MSFPVKKILLKTIKISVITTVSLLALMFLLPYLFPQMVTQKIKQWAGGSINGKLAFTDTRLSFFKKFPALTLTLDDFLLRGRAPFDNDTLVSAKEISLAIDLSSLLKSKININKIYLNQAYINIRVDSAGRANYNVYKGKTDKTATPADTASASLGIEQILIENSRLVYNDRSMPLLVNARGFNYKGSGDLSKDVFDLYSHTDASSVDFFYGNKPYVLNKKVNANLVTSINTKSLAFSFQKNDLLINRLPVQFKGKFEFLKDGYDMDFRIVSEQNNLNDIFTALPSEYAKYVEGTNLKGKGKIELNLIGKYISAKNIMPDLSLNLKVRNGYVANKNTPAPVTNLYVNMDAKVPGLNPNNLNLNIDSIYFNIGKDYFGSVIKIKGLKSPQVFAKINTEIDLEKWYKAFGIKSFQVKGRYKLNLLAEGKYSTGIKHTGIRQKVDTVITSIPKFTLRSSFRDGYLKYTRLPEALRNIRFDLNANCPDNNIAHATMDMSNINAEALNNYIKGRLKMSNAAGSLIDAVIKAKFHLADIKKFYPINNLNLKGDLFADLETKGRYIPKSRIFPHTKATISLQNGDIQTKYYPHPVQNINVLVKIVNNTGTLKGLKVDIKPISFNFEDKPFTLKADLKNFDDLDYNISSRGTLDIGKIYKVFALKGYDVKGLVRTNFNLKGKQSDATAGRYAQLANSGTLKVKDISLRSDLFPKPFFIRTGNFSFNQDKMKFEQFRADYGRSIILLNGALSNVFDYALKPNTPLKGEFNLNSDLIIADDFMAFAGTPATAKPTKASGVILVPNNLDLSFNANVKKVKYNGLNINDAKGQMNISNGQIILKQAGFNILGTPVVMDATYGSINPQKAFFDYSIDAKDFDIQRAYREVKLFHDMASSAAHVQGIISLNYKLSGKLSGDMMPIYSSLKGGGMLSVKKVKVKNFNLFSAVGKATGRDSLGGKNHLSKVDIKTTIANNIITIERTKMRMAGFRPRIEGQVSFSGALNLKFRLGLPPLGIFGIPMTITGTQEKPKVRLGRGKKQDELKEEKEE